MTCTVLPLPAWTAWAVYPYRGLRHPRRWLRNGRMVTARYFHESRTVRCVACRMVLTGTVAEVADRYRNHQCVERWYPIVDLPSLYTHVGVKK